MISCPIPGWLDNMRQLVDAAELEERLRAEFLADGLGLSELVHLELAEAEHARQVVGRLSGYNTRHIAFEVLVFETIHEIEKEVGRRSANGYSMFESFVFELVMCNRLIRASRSMFLSGYTSIAFGSLRGLKERVLFMGAIGNKISSQRRLWGVQQGVVSSFGDKEAEGVRKRRLNEEKRVLNVMLGEEVSANNDESPLKYWSSQFNMEVHGSQVAGLGELSRLLRGEGSDPMIPMFSQNGCWRYLSRVSQLSWMMHRLLPLCQCDVSSFSDEWARRWGVLDEAFGLYSDAIIGNSTKKDRDGCIAVSDLVKRRFSFSPWNSSYADCLED